MFANLLELDLLDATWLRIISELLCFCDRNSPPSSAWAGLPAGEPPSTIAGIQARTLAALAQADPAVLESLRGEPSARRPLSFASQSLREVLRNVAHEELDSTSLGDDRLRHVVVAHGVAKGIDIIANHTFLSWFRAKGEITLTAGQPYPVHGHDPRPWLGRYQPNSKPENLPTRDLAHTPHLRIAQSAPFTYVIDFDLWDRLSTVGARGALSLAVGQSNLHLGEFDTREDPDPPTTIANHGPADATLQARRIARIATAAVARDADILVLPEYTLTEPVHTALVDGTVDHWPRPALMCAGLAGSVDEDGYVVNEGWLLVNTPGMDQDFSVSLPRKLYPATVDHKVEKIRQSSEIRIFMAQRWTLCVLICRDSMDTSIADQLGAIGVNVLLVPAMSPKTATLTGSAAALCRTSQAFVAVANGPARWYRPDDPDHADTVQTTRSADNEPAARDEAFFAGPYDSEPASFSAQTTPTEAPELSVWVFTVSERTLTAHAISGQ